MSLPLGEIIRDNEVESKPKGKFLYISIQTLQRIERVCTLSTSSMPQSNFITRSSDNKVYKIPVSNALNTTEESYIKNSDSGEFWINGKDLKIKLGKILGQLWNNLDSTQIEQCITKWKATYTVDLGKVQTSKDIGMVYDIGSVGGSCMAGYGERMVILEDLGCEIAYLIDDDDRLLARALLWNGNIYKDNDISNTVKIMDRVFFRTEHDKITLDQWAKENDFERGFDGDYRTSKGVSGCYDDGVPYIDNMYTLIRSAVGGEYQLSNGYGNEVDILQSTQGNSEYNCGISALSNEDMVFCEDIDEDRHVDDTYYNNTHDCYYAYEDELVYMNGEYYHCEDIRLCMAVDTDEWCWVEDCTLAYDTDEYYETTDDLIFCYDNDEYVTTDGATYCEDDENYYYHNCSLYEAPDGTYWTTEDAYKEEQGTEDE